MRPTAGPCVKRDFLLLGFIWSLLVGLGFGVVPTRAAATPPPPVKVTCQGLFERDAIAIKQRPDGVSPEAGMLLTAEGRRIVIESPDTRALPSRVRVFEFSGRVSFDELVPLFSDPVLSPGGRYLAFRSGAEIRVLDLANGSSEFFGNGSPFGVGPSGELAVVSPPVSLDGNAGARITLNRAGATGEITLPVGVRVQEIGFEVDGQRLLILEDGRLLAAEVESMTSELLYAAPPQWRLRDMRTLDDGTIAIGLRRVADGCFEGRAVCIDREGNLLAQFPGVCRTIPVGCDLPRTSRGIPWPLTFNQQYPIGNTYGEYQNYGGAPYMHPGVDIMGATAEPIFAVEAGWVKAVLTTSGSYHWRVAIGDPPYGLGEGYLYAHLQESSIAVQVGDYVEQGTYLGGLVEWPIADFTHIHFAHISDSGAQWYGNWLNIDNPHLDLENLSETDFPFFEPALGSDLFAFCQNETSNYLNPEALQGEVDIIAHIGDRLWDDWVCTVQEIRYSIYPAGHPEIPIVDNKLGIYYDMILDTYQNGPIDPMMVDLFYKQDGTCYTEGNYDSREFYYIVTNSNGDLVYDEDDFQEAWNTTHSADGDYIVRVTALDAVGNATVDSMLVTTANGTLDVLATDGPTVLGPALPNPTLGGSRIQLRLDAPQEVHVGVFDATGRLVRRLYGGVLEAGDHSLAWDGRDAGGLAALPGVYFYRLESGGRMFERKLVIL